MSDPFANPLEWVKGAVFVLLIATLLAGEAWRPRRDARYGWPRRFRNVGLIAVSTIVLRLIFPLGAIGFAASWHFGLLHWVDQNWGRMPLAATILVSVLVLDLAIYWQHRAFHAWPWLWRAHRVHHTDTAFDVTLGVRFHPFEILPSYAWKLLVIAALGAPSIGVAIYEAGLLAFSLFSHANIAFPRRLDGALRKIVITPDWHRIHHSVHWSEANSNFGNFLSVWDRMFRTSKEQPRDGHETMHVGLQDFREPRAQGLIAMLLQPFKPIRQYAENTSQRDKSHA